MTIEKELSITTLDEIFQQQLSSWSVVTFDFFDTLVWRKKPEVDIIVECVTEVLGASIDHNRFLLLKDESETQLRQAAQGDLSDKETNIFDIYRDVFEKLKLSNIDELVIKFCKRLINIESDNLVLHIGVHNVFERLEILNKHIIIVSDTVYDHRAFEVFISKLSLDISLSNCYLSCVEKVNKYTGNLFKKLTKALQKDPNQFLHIGDNRYSDVIMAKECKLDAILFSPTLSIEEYRTLYDFGFSYLAPVLVNFIQEVDIKTSSNQLVFLGRDGYLMYKIAQSISSKEVHYLYVNRALSNQLITERLNRTILDFLSTEHKVEGIWGLVTVFGLSNTKFSKTFESFLNRVILSRNSLFNDVIIKQILEDNVLCANFSVSIRERRNALKDYMTNSLPDINESTFSLIDVGWRGQIFNKLNQTYPTIKNIHLLCSVEKQRNPNIIGYIDATKFTSFLDVFISYRPLIEFCLGEPIGSVLYIDEKNVPVVESNTKLECIEVIHRAVFDRVRDVEWIKKTPIKCEADLKNLVNYLQSLPKSFISSIKNQYPDLNITEQSSVSFSDLLATENKEQVQEAQYKNIQSSVYNFLTFIKKLKQSKSIVVYGAGSGAEFILPHIKDNCEYIVDISSSVQGQLLNNIKINNVDSLNSFEGLIVVSVIGRKQLLLEKLKQYGNEILFIEDYLV